MQIAKHGQGHGPDLCAERAKGLYRAYGHAGSWGGNHLECGGDAQRDLRCQDSDGQRIVVKKNCFTEITIQ